MKKVSTQNPCESDVMLQGWGEMFVLTSSANDFSGLLKPATSGENVSLKRVSFVWSILPALKTLLQQVF